MNRTFHVDQPTGEVRSRVLQVVTRSRGRITHESPGIVAASFRTPASLIVTGVLLFFGVLPGVLYWLLGRRADALLVEIADEDAGTRVTLTASGGEAHEAADAVAAAFGQTIPRRVASAVASGAAEAARSAGEAGHAVADRVSEAREKHAARRAAEEQAARESAAEKPAEPPLVEAREPEEPQD